MTTEILALDELVAGQPQKEVTVNTALRKLEGRLVRALSMTTAAPPTEPLAGDSYIVPAGATGAWAGYDGRIAHFYGGSWKFWMPIEGIRLWVNDLDTQYAFDGTAWVVNGGDPVAAAAAAITAHEAESDPHPQYLTATEAGAAYDALGAASSAVSAHVAASDPHTQYALESTIGAANGIAGLGSDGKVPAAQLPASATAGGTVTSVALTTPGVLYDVSGSPVTTSGTLALSLISQAVNRVLAGPSSGTSGAPSFRSLVAADLPAFVGSGAGHAAGIVPDAGSTAGTTRYLREDGTWVAPPGATSGTVTSVALTTPGLLFDVSGSPVTGAGTLAMTLKTQNANRVLAGPASGADAAPTMRALVAADLPAQPFDIHTFYPGVPSASAKLYRGKLARAVTFPANFAGAQFTASVNATASTVFDIQKNGSSVGSCTIASGGTTPTFASSGGAAVSFAAGDVFSVIAPATPDATLADPAITFAGTR